MDAIWETLDGGGVTERRRGGHDWTDGLLKLAARSLAESTSLAYWLARQAMSNAKCGRACASRLAIEMRDKVDGG